jgi:ParB-like chromosome segregation protein Spo0J
VAYQSGDRYIVADGNTRLAAARYVGSAYVLAEVWELP